MPIISTIGRKQWKSRLLILGIYLLLLGGAVTMVYPFLIMVAGSTKSGVDAKEFRPVPRFLADDTQLYRKHVEGLFDESLVSMKIAYDRDDPTFEVVEPPKDPNEALVAEWWQFVDQASLPRYAYTCGYMTAPTSRTTPQALREFKQYLSKKFDGDLDALNREMGTEFTQWYAVAVGTESFLRRREKPVDTPLAREFTQFKNTQPRWNLYFYNVDGFYKTLFLKTKYTKDIKAYNEAHKTRYKSYAEVHLPRRMPKDSPAEARDWTEFVRGTLNLVWIRADDGVAPLYREFLRAKYLDIQTLNRNYKTTYTSFKDVPLIAEPPTEGIVLSDWEAFLSGWKDPDTKTEYILPAEMIRLHSVEFLFRDYLRDKYGSLAAVNKKFSARYEDTLEILPPQRDAHYLAFREVADDLRWEFITRNFKAVLDYMVFHGRGVVNTVIYCSLTVLFALLVNPMAAYAMSRYKMPTSYKILLFLMLTMAFPPMVAQIPQFLMLREFGLLNTFAALILPGLANGYAIFLLKGFFDSLPRELYESAALDGAGEIRIFWQITMSLSKPILAVIALQAFTMAYSNFMMALLICQDEKMWTLMVWLYQLRVRSGPGVQYASLLIAAIPTLLIFIFCQKIIMRGIVVPVEK